MKSVRGFTLVVVLVIAALLIGAGGTVAYFKYLRINLPYMYLPPPSVPLASPSQSPNSQIAQSPTLNETANWKTYTNLEFTFKYPSTFDLTETAKQTNQWFSVSLKSKNIQIVGDKNHNDVAAGTSINFVKFETGKDSYKNTLSQFNQNQITQTKIGQKDALLVNLKTNPKDRQMTIIYVPTDYGFLNITFTSGSKDTTINQDTFFAEFDQILSTFRFDSQ